MSQKLSDRNFDHRKTYRNWIWTLHKPTDEQIEHIKSKITSDICKYIIYGHELTSDGKPHLQGYIELINAVRFEGLKKLLDPIEMIVSVEPRAIKATREHNRIYCSKGLQSHTEYEELGINGPNYGLKAIIYEKEFKKSRQGQGCRNDWNELYDYISENPDYGKILKEYPEYAIKYQTGIMAAIRAVKNEQNVSDVKQELTETIPVFYDWQNQLLKELDAKPNNRKIIWYYDAIGGNGKTTFAKWLHVHKDAFYCENGKKADVAHSYNGERIALFDFTRDVENFVSYSVIEQIKNGLIFSGKYDSHLKVNCTPHIVCFSNFYPDKSKLSADRWDIRPLNEVDKVTQQTYVLPQLPKEIVPEQNNTPAITGVTTNSNENIISSDSDDEFLDKIEDGGLPIGHFINKSMRRKRVKPAPLIHTKRGKTHTLPLILNNYNGQSDNIIEI